MKGNPFHDAQSQLDELERSYRARAKEALREFAVIADKDRANLEQADSQGQENSVESQRTRVRIVEAERNFRTRLNQARSAFSAGIERARLRWSEAERAAKRPGTSR